MPPWRKGPDPQSRSSRPGGSIVAERSLIIIPWGCLLLAVSLVIGSSESFRNCEHTHKDYDPYRPLHEDGPTITKAAARLRLHTSCVVYSTHENEELLTLLATILIAGFTGHYGGPRINCGKQARSKRRSPKQPPTPLCCKRKSLLRSRRQKCICYDWIWRPSLGLVREQKTRYPKGRFRVFHVRCFHCIASARTDAR